MAATTARCWSRPTTSCVRCRSRCSRASAAALVAALAQLEPGVSRLDYGTLVTGASAWAPAPGERLLIHLVTDLQQSGSPLRFADLQPPPGAAVELVDVGGADDRNLHVVAAGPAERRPQAIAVRIDGDREAVGTRELIVEVDGTERARRRLDPALPLPRLETFDVGELGEGDHRILARLTPGDALAGDDAYRAVLRQIAPRVLLVAASPTGTDTAYLRTALQALATPAFRVETSAPGAAATRTLAEFAAVIVSDAGILDTRAADALRRYAEGGGAVLMTLGPRSQRLERIPVGQQAPATGRRRAQGNEAARVGPVDESHPVLREPSGWRQVRFFRHVPVEPRDGETVLLRFENGSPLLLEQRIGQGRVLTLTSPLDRDWNDLAIHPLFVRFIGEAAAYLTGDTGAARTAMVGTTTVVDLGGRAGAQVFDPQGRRASMLGGSAGERRLAPDQTGFYELRGGGRSEWIAVNPDPRESRLARLPPAAVEQWRGLRALPEPSAAGAVSPEGSDAGTRLIPVWMWLLVAAALLAFAEPLVANYYLFVRRERGA
jgi:hypothetical protein